jgi:hypothetical protein
MSKQTTAEVTVFIPEFDAFNAGHGSMHIPVHVHGFWSDVITIHVRRDTHWQIDRDSRPAPTWDIEIIHSSGGRDTDEVKDDVLAHEYFAHAVLAACHMARKIRSQTEVLEKAYQERQAKEQAFLEAEQAAKAKAAESDQALGEVAATVLITDIGAKTTRRQERQFRVYDRGSDTHPTIFTSRMGQDGVVRFFKSGVMLSRKNAIADLAALSSRVTFDNKE